MSRFVFLLREALVNLKRNFLVVAGAVLAVFISLSLAFGALVVNQLLRLNTLAWQEGVHVIAFLQDEGSQWGCHRVPTRPCSMRSSPGKR